MDRQGNRQPLLPQAQAAGAREVGHGHMANQGQNQAILLPFPPTQLGFHSPDFPPLEHANRFEKKKTEKHVSLLARVSFPFPFSRWKARSSFKDIHLSFLCPLGTSLWQGPENRKWAWHLPGLFQRLAGARNMPWSRHLLPHLAAPGRSDQSGAEFQNQALPARGRGSVPAWNWKWVWMVPRTQEVCSPSSTPGELGCSTDA